MTSRDLEAKESFIIQWLGFLYIKQDTPLMCIIRIGHAEQDAVGHQYRRRGEIWKIRQLKPTEQLDRPVFSGSIKAKREVSVIDYIGLNIGTSPHRG